MKKRAVISAELGEDRTMMSRKGGFRRMNSRRDSAEDRVDPRRCDGAIFEAFVDRFDGLLVVLWFHNAVDEERCHLVSKFGRLSLSQRARTWRSGDDVVRRMGLSQGRGQKLRT